MLAFDFNFDKNTQLKMEMYIWLFVNHVSLEKVKCFIHPQWKDSAPIKSRDVSLYPHLVK
jgi:hypothetical protein